MVKMLPRISWYYTEFFSFLIFAVFTYYKLFTQKLIWPTFLRRRNSINFNWREKVFRLTSLKNEELQIIIDKSICFYL